MPGTQVLADLADMQDDADNLGRAIRYVYQQQNLPLLIPTVVRSSLMAAPGYLYPWFDPNAGDGDGEIKFKQLPWKNVWLDGSAQTIEQSSKARIKIPLRRNELLRIWPDKADELKGSQGSSQSSQSSSEMLESRDQSGASEEMGKPSEHKSDDLLDYVETWVKSFDLEEIPEEETLAEIEKENESLMSITSPEIKRHEDHEKHQEGHFLKRVELVKSLGLNGEEEFEEIEAFVDQLIAQNPEGQDALRELLLRVKLIDNHIEEHEHYKSINPSGGRPKYVDGWRVIKSVGKIILYDGGNPEENGHIPIVPFYCYKDDSIYGFGEIKNIFSAQNSLNEMDFKEYKGLKRVANPGFIKDKEADVDDNELTNDDGLIITKKKGTEVKRMDPGTISPQLERRKVTDEAAIEDISGMNEATQGKIPSANASGVTVEKLQNQAIGRIRLKDRYLQHYSMRRLAIITASLIINNWSLEKRLRLRGDNNSIEEFVFDPVRMSDLGFTIEIAPGSMAGIDKEALNGFYMQLLDKGHITYSEYLLISSFPKRELLLEKLKEREEQEAELNELNSQIEQLTAQIEEISKQNIILKGLINPELLSMEESKVLSEQARAALLEKLLSNETGASDGQPV